MRKVQRKGALAGRVADGIGRFGVEMSLNHNCTSRLECDGVVDVKWLFSQSHPKNAFNSPSVFIARWLCICLYGFQGHGIAILAMSRSASTDAEAEQVAESIPDSVVSVGGRMVSENDFIITTDREQVAMHVKVR